MDSYRTYFRGWRLCDYDEFDDCTELLKFVKTEGVRAHCRKRQMQYLQQCIDGVVV